MLIRDGLLTLPVYHGTSSVNLSSICENGLGGRNFIEELNLVPFIRELYATALDVVPDSEPGWSTLRVELEPIAGQRITGGGLNYRHGSTYLTPSCSSAARYAQSSPEGSELLSNANAVLDLIARHDPRGRERIEQLNPAAASRLRQTGDPVVLRAVDVPLSELRSEQGGDAHVVIDQIEQMFRSLPFTEENINLLCQQANFELISPLPADHLVLFEAHGGSLIERGDPRRLLRNCGSE